MIQFVHRDVGMVMADLVYFENIEYFEKKMVSMVGVEQYGNLFWSKLTLEKVIT